MALSLRLFIVFAALLLPLASSSMAAPATTTSTLVGNWRAEGFVIPNSTQGVSLITTNANGTFRAQLGAVGTGTVSGQAASGTWRFQNEIISFVLMQINNATVPPQLSKPILFKIDTVTATEVQCRSLATGRSTRFVRLNR